MPIEIRELVIKTEVRTQDYEVQRSIDDHTISLLKQELMESCKRLLTERNKRGSYRR